MIGRLYFSIGICTKFFYDSKRNGFDKVEKVAFLLKKLSNVTRNPKCSTLLAGLAYFFGCDETITSFEAKNAMRPFIIAGNLKMNVMKKDIEDLFIKLKKVEIHPEFEIVVALPSVYLHFPKKMVPKNITLAAQNCYRAPQGSYTGEISPSMLMDVGVQWVVLGHSERRQMFCETNEVIRQKICHSLSQGMSVIVCVGETLEEKQNKKSEEVISRQLGSMCSSVVDWTKVVIAYEPLWVTPNDKAVDPQEVEDIHCKIRKWLKTHVSPTAAQITRIIYAGPLSGIDCAKYSKMRDIDGFLFDKTPFDPEEFIEVLYDGTDF
ncbi:triosephosphate isomerase [Halyomorpha halys]|uniref:triosephosphate isomerase n=1 Tax=Halyomorpha halys TaxID=286706 RepID=UPI0006D4EDFF|nr:triosephosphate isomerase-like [Halyomorpha halys]